MNTSITQGSSGSPILPEPVNTGKAQDASVVGGVPPGTAQIQGDTMGVSEVAMDKQPVDASQPNLPKPVRELIELSQGRVNEVMANPWLAPNFLTNLKEILLDVLRMNSKIKELSAEEKQMLVDALMSLAKDLGALKRSIKEDEAFMHFASAAAGILKMAGGFVSMGLGADKGRALSIGVEGGAGVGEGIIKGLKTTEIGIKEEQEMLLNAAQSIAQKAMDDPEQAKREADDITNKILDLLKATENLLKDFKPFINRA